MRNQLLRDADWASMAHSLELRTPLVDVVLWETVLQLVIAGYDVRKQDMARSPTRPLPRAILERRKTGFSIPVREWLRAHEDAGSQQPIRGMRDWALHLHRKTGLSETIASVPRAGSVANESNELPSRNRRCAPEFETE